MRQAVAASVHMTPYKLDCVCTDLMCCFFHLEDCDFLNVVKAFIICKGRPLADAAYRAELALRYQ